MVDALHLKSVPDYRLIRLQWLNRSNNCHFAIFFRVYSVGFPLTFNSFHYTCSQRLDGYGWDSGDDNRPSQSCIKFP